MCPTRSAPRSLCAPGVMCGVREDRRGNGVSPGVHDESPGREQRQDDGEREQRE